MMELNEAIRGRRTITPSCFSGEKLDDQVILKLLENANFAPSHRNTEPWRFRVVTGKGLERLADYFQKTYSDHTPSQKYSAVKYKKLRQNIEASSHVLVLSMQLEPEPVLPEWEEIAASAMAIQNLWLSCQSYGVAGYWSSPGTMIKNIDNFEKMKANEKCLGFFYLGIKKPEIELKKEKKDVLLKTSWIRE